MEYSSVPMTQSAKALKKAAAEDKAAAIQRDASLRQLPTLTNTCRTTDKQAEVSYGQQCAVIVLFATMSEAKNSSKRSGVTYTKSTYARKHICRASKLYQLISVLILSLFKKDGKMDRGSELYKMKKQREKEHKTSSAKKTLVLV
ncbi:hypothetical protein AeMF1_003205 [Aphanomyces euteiches]|nr:hypothetical protein AeMF1_003205 [Aphanomyces euteiches]